MSDAELQASRWPWITAARQRRYEQRFIANRDTNMFRGVYASLAQAQASAPTELPVGYDNSGAASMYLDRTRRIHVSDYPVIYWLQHLFRQGLTRLFDLGGHVGVSYYAYRRYLEYPVGLQWTVHDVPAVMEQGRRFAEQKGAQATVQFAERFEEASGYPLLVAQGSLQYLPETLAERLATLAQPPRHVIVNQMPLHERETYCTLQSIGTAFCPYRVQAQGDFLRGLDQLGYALVDAWDNPEKSCLIPFHPTHSLDRYHGFYFRRS